MRCEVDLSVGLLEQPQGVGLVLSRSQAGSCAASETTGVASARKAGERRPVDQVQPELPVIVPPQVVIAEQVRVGGDDDAPPIGDGREQGGAGRLSGGAGAKYGAAGASVATTPAR